MNVKNNCYYSKDYIIDEIWLYHKYYGNRLIECENLYNDGYSYAATIQLFTLLENICKSKVGNFEITFQNVINEIKRLKYISEKEFIFLNEGDSSIRKIRNLLAHENLGKINFISRDFTNDANEIFTMYPFTEDTTYDWLYDKISLIIFNIFYKIVRNEDIVLDSLIDNINLEIRELSSSKILKLKGFNKKNIDAFENLELNENSKILLAEDQQDVNVLTAILSSLKIGES